MKRSLYNRKVQIGWHFIRFLGSKSCVKLPKVDYSFTFFNKNFKHLETLKDLSDPCNHLLDSVINISLYLFYHTCPSLSFVLNAFWSKLQLSIHKCWVWKNKFPLALVIDVSAKYPTLWSPSLWRNNWRNAKTNDDFVIKWSIKKGISWLDLFYGFLHISENVFLLS